MTQQPNLYFEPNGYDADQDQKKRWFWERIPTSLDKSQEEARHSQLG